MIDKRVDSMAAALAGVSDGETILLGGFGSAGLPTELIDALLDTDATDLVVVSNNAGGDDSPIARLIWEKRVRRFICSYPRSVSGAHQVRQRWEEGAFELELVPQGTMSERMRAAGAGLGGFFTPTAGGTTLAEGKETRMINGRLHVFEEPLPGDYGLIKADRADRWGNLTYHASGRNFGPTIASAARNTVVQVREIVDLGELEPEHIVTPGIFVDRVIEVGA